jgi:hypothetical protein
VIKTSAGELTIIDVELADRFPPNCTGTPPHCREASKGSQFLIVWMDSKDAGNLNAVSTPLLRLFDLLPGLFDQCLLVCRPYLVIFRRVSEHLEKRVAWRQPERV